ncbi:hypothetical protein MHYP_G00349380 [Metynnis hypsauchen]
MASSGMGGGRNGRDPSSSGPGFYSEHKIKQAKPLRRPEELRGSLRRLDLKVLGRFVRPTDVPPLLRERFPRIAAFGADIDVRESSERRFRRISRTKSRR